MLTVEEHNTEAEQTTPVKGLQQVCGHGISNLAWFHNFDRLLSPTHCLCRVQ